tara:strand:- start:389 stop:1246 length:858 start_codon:yes stop_codon:yes gene_type:complete
MARSIKVAFVGDSYCADADPDSFLDIIIKSWPSRNPVNMLCRGLRGMALFHAYQKLVEVVDRADYIILCITSADRLATRHNMPCMPQLLDFYLDPAQDIDSHSHGQAITTELDNFLEDYELAPAPVKGKAKENGRKILQAARDFYEHLYDEEYFKSIQVGLLMQIDQLMLQKKKKCIWFTCVDHLWTKKNYPEWYSWITGYPGIPYYSNFIPKSGPYGNEALYDISMSEDDIPDLERIGFDPRINHFNAQNNINMANLIIDIIRIDKWHPYEIKLENYFVIRPGK